MSKAGKMGDRSVKGAARKRFLIGTDTRCVRILNVTEGKKRFVWGVEDGNKGYCYVTIGKTELR